MFLHLPFKLRCSRELESHVGRYRGRCLTRVERRIVIGGIGGGGIGDVVAGAAMDRAFRMKRLFRTRTLPLFVLTKYFRFDPSSMMVP